jgi:hypothetical protein
LANIPESTLTNTEIHSLLLTKDNEQSTGRVSPMVQPEDMPKAVIMYERTSHDICSRLLQLGSLF